MTMLPEERKQFILEEIQRHGKIGVVTTANTLQVAPETIRRDLADLEGQQLLKRVYGGAIGFTHAKAEPRFEKKQNMMREAKIAIGSKAASYIQDGDTIVLDVGTTTLELARAIRGVVRVTVVTNSLAAANVLMEALEARLFDGRVIMLGGTTQPAQKSVTGALTYEMLSNFRFDKAFLSCGGITATTVSDYEMEEALCSSVMSANAEQVFVLADHTKLDKSQFYNICPLAHVSTVISSDRMPTNWTAHGIPTTWVVA
ncbi:DeoR/GlpR family DNA-binding transcription regulator [Paenibacillus taiwanensis]|uniref:DeoR/GlpR family DNA-binding transcription regulator n=1 Tax=Paenibacillus taiwanensis TaxID=401638 RepID=UPI0004077766|nr:DeoR/GlpR family DNA-binding transcription regulator [Paenibacillus taiwanensis]